MDNPMNLIGLFLMWKQEYYCNEWDYSVYWRKLTMRIINEKDHLRPHHLIRLHCPFWCSLFSDKGK